MEVTRRAALAGGLAVTVAGHSTAAPIGYDGAAGIIVTPQGVAGMTFESENGSLFDPAFDWHIGSNTKAMTAALYACLVDRGLLRWNAGLGELFPGLAIHEDWRATTIEDLLCHAAGLGDEAIDRAWLTARRADRDSPGRQRRTFVEHMFARPMAGRPGTYRYANANYVVAGAAIEQATGTSWEATIQRDLFGPLGISGRFGAPPPSGIWGREEVLGGLAPVDPAGIADNPPVLWPSGGVRLRLGDYARFLAAFLPGGPAMLRPETLTHLLTPTSLAGRYAGGWSLEGPSRDSAATLTHDGSNSFWFATATLSRRDARGYAAVVNKGGDAGAAVTESLIGRMQAPRPG